MIRGQQRHYRMEIPAGPTLMYCVQFLSPETITMEIRAFVHVGSKAGPRLFTNWSKKVGAGIEIGAPGADNPSAVSTVRQFRGADVIFSSSFVWTSRRWRCRIIRFTPTAFESAGRPVLTVADACSAAVAEAAGRWAPPEV